MKYMQLQDMPSILDIEAGSFDLPWTEDEFIRRLDQVKCTSLVMKKGDKTIGYLVYKKRTNCLELLNFAVHPELRRQGIGTAMLQEIMKKVCKKRPELFVKVPDTNLAAHLFLKSLGFVAKSIENNYFKGDEYLFVFTQKD